MIMMLLDYIIFILLAPENRPEENIVVSKKYYKQMCNVSTKNILQTDV